MRLVIRIIIAALILTALTLPVLLAQEHVILMPVAFSDTQPPTEGAQLQATANQAAADMLGQSAGAIRLIFHVAPTYRIATPAPHGCDLSWTELVLAAARAALGITGDSFDYVFSGPVCPQSNTAWSDCHGLRTGWFEQMTEGVLTHERWHQGDDRHPGICPHSFGAILTGTDLSDFDPSRAVSRERVHPYSIMGSAYGPDAVPTFTELLTAGLAAQSQNVNLGRDVLDQTVTLAPIEQMRGTLGLSISGASGTLYRFEYRQRARLGPVVSVSASIGGLLSYIGSLGTGNRLYSSIDGIDVQSRGDGAIRVRQFDSTAAPTPMPTPGPDQPPYAVPTFTTYPPSGPTPCYVGGVIPCTPIPTSTPEASVTPSRPPSSPTWTPGAAVSATPPDASPTARLPGASSTPTAAPPSASTTTSTPNAPPSSRTPGGGSLGTGSDNTGKVVVGALGAVALFWKKIVAGVKRAAAKVKSWF